MDNVSVNILQKITKKEYKKLYRQTHDSTRKTVRQLFETSAQQSHTSPIIISYDENSSQEFQNTQNQTVCVHISDGDDENMETISTNVTILPAIASVRELIAYVPTMKNIATRGNLTGIPYLGDEFNNDDQKLINSISGETKQQTFHRIRNRKLDEQSLEILYQTIRTNKICNDYTDDDIIDAIIYYHHDSSPRSRLITFANQLSSHNQNLDTSNMDIDDFVIKRWCSRFCPRCYTYNCLLHRDTYSYLPLARQISFSSTDQTSPCSSICYKHKHDSRKCSLSPAYSSDDDDDEENICPKKRQRLSSMTFDDRNLFRLFYFLFDGNLCLMSQIIFSPKTCLNLYEYYLIDRNYLSSRTSDYTSNKFLIRQNYRRQMLDGSTRAFLLHMRKCQTNKSKAIYQPCSHDGPCMPTNKDCSCMKNGTFCEKFCNCSIDCSHRFPGCNCKSSCLINRCLCYDQGRECDPDLCQKCGASRLSNQTKSSSNSCANISLQRKVYKQILIAESDVAGYGAFLASDVAYPGELIGEYMGEIISEEEAERRGRLYDKRACSYLFNFDRKRCVDARQFGSKIRFANHSSKPNCIPKIKFVNGDYRIGIYAKQMIFQGDELFFEYMYNAQQRQQFVNNERIDQYECNGLQILKHFKNNFLLVQSTYK